MMDHLQFFDVAQYLNSCQSPDYVVRRRPSTPVTNYKRFVWRELEELVWAASGIAAGDYPYPRARPNNHIRVREDVLHVTFIRSLKVEGCIRCHNGMAFGHFGSLSVFPGLVD